MGFWPSTKAKKVYAALRAIGWSPKAYKSGSHITLERQGWDNYTWAFNDADELGPQMLARIAKHTGLTPGDL